jgi:hypothetical protein
MLTYEKIIKESEEFAANHDQINNFDNGDLWEVVEKNTIQNYTYPLLFMQDGISTTDLGVLTFQFNVIAMDQVLNGERNENFVKSSMHQILLDYLAFFKHTYLYDVEGAQLRFKIQPSATLTSFTERFNDTLTGWNMSVTFRIPFDFSKCSIPLRNVIPPPTPFECADAILTLNEGTFITVASGSTTDIILLDQDGNEVTPTSVVGSTITVNVGACDDATVTVNGNAFATVPSGDTLDVEVVNDNGNQIGSFFAPNFWAIGDSAISINGTLFENVKATEPLDIDVVNTEATLLTGSIVSNQFQLPDVELSFVVDGGTPVNETVPYQKNETINIEWL